MPPTSITFVSKASIESGVVKSYNLRKRVEAVKNCRNIGKKDMKYNDSMPKMKVDPERYVSGLQGSAKETVADLKLSRPLKRMEWYVRRSRRQSCHSRRRTSSTERTEFSDLGNSIRKKNPMF